LCGQGVRGRSATTITCGGVVVRCTRVEWLPNRRREYITVKRRL